MGGTPKAFLDIGLSNLPMTMDQTHVNYALNGKNGDLNHKLGEALLKQLPEMMKNPVAVFASRTHPGDSVMVIHQGIVNGAKETAVINISDETRLNNDRYDVNHLVTVQGRGNAENLLMNAIKSEAAGNVALFYWDKAKATQLCGQGLQLPKCTQPNGFVYTINDKYSVVKHKAKAIQLMNGKGLQLPNSSPANGLVHSIDNVGSPVKLRFIKQTDTKQFDRWFGNSKMADEKGKPRIYRHGTNSGDFYIFDKNLIGTAREGDVGFYGNGFCFAYTEGGARGYGKDVKPACLKIENPFNFQRELWKGNIWA